MIKECKVDCEISMEYIILSNKEIGRMTEEGDLGVEDKRYVLRMERI